MVLVNGAMGLATGYSTRIPNHDPQKIIETLLQMIEYDGKMDGRASLVGISYFSSIFLSDFVRFLEICNGFTFSFRTFIFLLNAKKVLPT